MDYVTILDNVRIPREWLLLVSPEAAKKVVTMSLVSYEFDRRHGMRRDQLQVELEIAGVNAALTIEENGTYWFKCKDNNQ